MTDVFDRECDAFRPRRQADRPILAEEPDGTALAGQRLRRRLLGLPVRLRPRPRRAPTDDLILERNGATVLIDSVSLPFMAGSEIDFVDDLIGQSFQIKNPNATASCGCGTSFSI